MMKRVAHVMRNYLFQPDFSHKKLINFFNLNQYFSSNSNKSWEPIAKTGAILIGIGLLIFFLKELIIGILSAPFIGLGIYFLVKAFNLWNSNRLY